MVLLKTSISSCIKSSRTLTLRDFVRRTYHFIGITHSTQITDVGDQRAPFIHNCELLRKIFGSIPSAIVPENEKKGCRQKSLLRKEQPITTENKVIRLDMQRFMCMEHTKSPNVKLQIVMLRLQKIELSQETREKLQS
jgi:hypothetical protein